MRIMSETPAKPTIEQSPYCDFCGNLRPLTKVVVDDSHGIEHERYWCSDCERKAARSTWIGGMLIGLVVLAVPILVILKIIGWM